MSEFGYNSEQAEAAAVARDHPSAIRVSPAAVRRRHRVVYDRQTAEHTVVDEPSVLADEVRDEVTAALVHEIQFGRPVRPPDWFDADQAAEFARQLAVRRAVAGR
jgi:hypothetical protein